MLLPRTAKSKPEVHKIARKIGMRGNSRVLVLLSGGIDSSGCVAFFLREKFRVSSLFVDYGQAARTQEARASRAVSDYYSIPYRQFRLVGERKKSKGLIIGRNAFLILTALMEMKEQSGLIALGIHSGTDYWDCSPGFLRLLQSLVENYTRGRVVVSAPFLKWTKSEVWDFCVSQQVPLHLTYSCESGLDQPCGQCLSCRDLEALYARP